MKKMLGVISITLMANACISHPAQYQSLSVTLKNNEPCFNIPKDSGLDKPITSHSPTIMKRKGAQWETISPPATYTPVITLNPEECHQWNGIQWQSGEYDVVLKLTGKNDSVRYAARFVLEKKTSGQFQLLQSE